MIITSRFIHKQILHQSAFKTTGCNSFLIRTSLPYPPIRTMRTFMSPSQLSPTQPTSMTTIVSPEKEKSHLENRSTDLSDQSPSPRILSPTSQKKQSRTLFSHLFGGRSPTTSSATRKHTETQSKRNVRVGAEDETFKRNRRNMDFYLRRLGDLMEKDVCLNEQGMAFFNFQKKFIVVVEVPEDNCGYMYIYTMVCRINPETDNQAAILKRCMELNYLVHGTRGATLGLDGEEVNICYTSKLSRLTFDDFREAMQSFLRTAKEINCQLNAIKNKTTQPLQCLVEG